MKANIKKYSRGNAGIKYKRYEINSVNMHWHDDFYEIELVTKGTGIHKVNGMEYEWKKGEIHLMRPVDFHEIVLDGSGEVCLFQIHPADLPEEFRQRVSGNSENMVAYLSETQFESADALFRILEGRIPGGDDDTRKVYEHILSLIILLFFSDFSKKPVSAKGELSGRIVTYLNENFRDELTLDRIADEFYITKNYLCSYFKRNTNKTVINYIKELRLAYAAKLAVMSNLGSIEICSACGYGSVSNFLRDFKKKYGASPMQVRNSNNIHGQFATFLS